MNTIDIEKLNQLISRTDISGNDKVRWLTDFIDGRELQFIQDEFYSEEEVEPLIEILKKCKEYFLLKTDKCSEERGDAIGQILEEFEKK